jgi:phosphate transport system permease protein
MNQSIYRRRRLINKFNIIISVLAMLFGLFWLGWILMTLFSHGSDALLTWGTYAMDTPPPGTEGGIRNAIVGSLYITLFGLIIGTPIGIMAGIYLAEFSQNNWFAKTTRFINDILLSAPSIVIGLFIYELVVVYQGHFSGWAGSLALSLLVIPVVIRTTENMLKLVPNTLREAAYALGTPKWKLVTMVTLRAAKTGVLTGILLAFARVSGETAPLIFTALNNNFYSSNMNEPMANLPNMILQFAITPYADLHRLAWGAALLITLTVLITNILARFLSRNSAQNH